MRIQELQFHDKYSDWKLAPTEFFSDLTLLVGISGVGKTRILRAVSALRDITEGDDDEFFWGVDWQTTFTTDDGSEYCWRGAFEERESSADRNEFEDDLPFVWPFEKKARPRPKILEEFLSRDGNPIVERDNGVIRLREKQTPKLSPYESAVKILSEEDDVSLSLTKSVLTG
jgi:ABC-type iron transport system FetAB ATPase subunit